ncbi:transporter substrate-binding domain-containing protein [Paraburkholderia bannensis]|uniref:transporter substrate-binding domain-containing protein n=1 Tax=Paraburkholderia bannensis TaxID=765414 RepID=UPI002ABD59F5|nr:transporter substrate-binding domain-containing protein [Paraburkholderia bannensis]
MNRLLRALPAALSLCLAAATTGAHAGTTLQRVEQSHTLRVIVVDNDPPFGFIDDSNRLTGFDVDVAKALAQRLGAKLVLDSPSWENIVGGHWNGRWDVCVCSMTPNAERAKALDFAAPYYSSPAVLVVNRADTHIRSAADLTGRKVGVGFGSSYESYLQKTLSIPGEKPIAFPFGAVQIVPDDESVAFQNLALGPGVRLDAVITDEATANLRIKRTPVFRIVSRLYVEPNWIAADKGDPEWNARLAAAIQALRADGTLSRLSLQWMQEDTTR